jgi:hypothetical protein
MDNGMFVSRNLAVSDAIDISAANNGTNRSRRVIRNETKTKTKANVCYRAVRSSWQLHRPEPVSCQSPTTSRSMTTMMTRRRAVRRRWRSTKARSPRRHAPPEARETQTKRTTETRSHRVTLDQRVRRRSNEEAMCESVRTTPRNGRPSSTARSSAAGTSCSRVAFDSRSMSVRYLIEQPHNEFDESRESTVIENET